MAFGIRWKEGNKKVKGLRYKVEGRKTAVMYLTPLPYALHLTPPPAGPF